MSFEVLNYLLIISEVIDIIYAQGNSLLSTYFGVSKLISLKGVLASIIIVLISATAWQGSTSSGGDKFTASYSIMREVLKHNRMSFKCYNIGIELIESSISQRISKLRPTTNLWKKKEGRIADKWLNERCPIRALLPMSYGATIYAQKDAMRRINW